MPWGNGGGCVRPGSEPLSSRRAGEQSFGQVFAFFDLEPGRANDKEAGWFILAIRTTITSGWLLPTAALVALSLMGGLTAPVRAGAWDAEEQANCDRVSQSVDANAAPVLEALERLPGGRPPAQRGPHCAPLSADGWQGAVRAGVGACTA